MAPVQENNGDSYLVRYDDNDTEELSLVDIHEALVQFYKLGEKNRGGHLGARLEKISSAKRQASKVAAQRLEAERDNVRLAAQKKRREMAATVSARKASALNYRFYGVRRPIQSPPIQPPPRSDTQPVPLPPKKRPKHVVDSRVAKFFDGDVYFGTIVGTVEDGDVYWQVRYDDGDREEFDKEDLDTALQVYERHKGEDVPKKRRKGKA
mmetsp:Transcript_11768/g.27266  ORF Transcript_11768/g.27266 Transcript_11768/m.27266 type:complete len:209 (-) Transcript_11768:317-943(-)